jgi:hypothetical protein
MKSSRRSASALKIELLPLPKIQDAYYPGQLILTLDRRERTVWRKAPFEIVWHSELGRCQFLSLALKWIKRVEELRVESPAIANASAALCLHSSPDLAAFCRVSQYEKPTTQQRRHDLEVESEKSVPTQVGRTAIRAILTPG